MADPFADPFADDESAAPAAGKKALKNFGETGEITEKPRAELKNFGETGAIEEKPAPEGPDLDVFGDTAMTESPTRRKKKQLENFGETGAIEEKPRAPLKNFGETGEITEKPRAELQNFGETGGIDDPFADSAGVAGAAAALEEPPSRGPLRTGDNEENVIAIVGEEPEPDSRAPFMEKSDETLDLPQTDLESLRTPSFVKDTADAGGSEALVMNPGAKDLVGGAAAEDLRDVAEPPPLTAEEAAARGDDDTGAASTGVSDDTADKTADADADADATADEEEPDFLYGEKFADKYKVAEGPPPKPSRTPQIVAAVGGVLLVGAMIFLVYKFSSGPREFEGVEVPKPTVISTPVKPTTAGSRPTSAPVKPVTPAPVVVEPKKPPVDAPPPLPPPQDEIDAKIRRALSWGLPIEAPKEKQAEPPSGTAPAPASKEEPK